MNNKLKIALKCTKYLLVATLVALPFIGPEKTEAKRPAGYTFASVPDTRCPSGTIDICYALPGSCPNTDPACQYSD